MGKKQLLYWIWLSLAMGIANRATTSLINAFGDASAVYGASADELFRVEGLSKKTRRALSEKSLSDATRVFDLCEQKGISILAYTDEAFPDALRTIEAPPVLLYYRGNLPDLNRRLCVATVGTRDMSEYGMLSAYKISYEIAAANAVVVSGMALGIDGVCSAAALAAKGQTVVFLGCGVDVLYPKRHRVLCEEICKNGAVMSEYPPTTLPLKKHFPERNRLISGTCRATLAVEGDERSGALITAREALSEGRAVYALPGDVDRASARGMNLLLKEGASPLLSVREILCDFSHTYPSLLVPDLTDGQSAACTPERTYLERMGILKASRSEERLPTEKKRTERAPKAAEPTEETVAPDESILSTLPPLQAEILRCIAQKGRDACVDDVYALPYPFSEISAAMTQLEIKQMIRHLPGSLLGLNQAHNF